MRKGGPGLQKYDHNQVGRNAVERSNYHMGGELYTKDAGQSKALATAGTYYVVTGNYTVGLESGTGYVVGSAANGTITIGEKGGGRYKVEYGASFSADKACTIHWHVYKNGVMVDGIGAERDIANPNDVGSAHRSGKILLVSGDVLDIRYSSDTNTTTVSINHCNFNITWEGGE